MNKMEGFVIKFHFLQNLFRQCNVMPRVTPVCKDRPLFKFKKDQYLKYKVNFYIPEIFLEGERENRTYNALVILKIVLLV